MLEHLGETPAKRLFIGGLILAGLGGGFYFLPSTKITIGDAEISGESLWVALLIFAGSLFLASLISWMTQPKNHGFQFATDETKESKVEPPKKRALVVPTGYASAEDLDRHISTTDEAFHIECFLLFARIGRKIKINRKNQLKYWLAANQLEGLGLIKKGSVIHEVSEFVLSVEQYRFIYSQTQRLQDKLAELTKPQEYALASTTGTAQHILDGTVARLNAWRINYRYTNGNLVVLFSSEKELEKAKQLFKDAAEEGS